MALLNLTNIPGEMISGASDEMLEWLSVQSGERFVSEISNEFLTMLNQDDNDIPPDIDQEIDEKLKALEEEAIPQSTEAQTRRYVEKFRLFLREKQLSPEFEKTPDEILNNYLRYFYSSLKKEDNSYYSPSTLVCIRASIQRFLSSANINRNVNIITDPTFKRANKTLKAMVSKAMSFTVKNEEKFPAIENSDMILLRTYFDRSTPQRLQREVWFSLTYYFGFRGREVMRETKKDFFRIEHEAGGRRAIVINMNSIYKNTKASLTEKEFQNFRNTKVYSSENPSTCPVRAFELYLGLIPEAVEVLFPQPLVKPRPNEMWYSSKKVVGKNGIGDFMKTISKEANLSKVYTNHSVRVTTISELFSQGFTVDQIQSVSGHKNPQSIQRYIRKRRAEDFSKVSDALNRGFGGSCETATSALSQSSRFESITPQFNIVSETITTTEEMTTTTFSAPTNKKMVIDADGNLNKVTITFS